MEISADIAAHFIFVDRNTFIGVSPIGVQQVTGFSRSISSAKSDTSTAQFVSIPNG